MKTDTKRSECVTRDAIVNLLSDAEVARVILEWRPCFSRAGDEYIDLRHLDRGVRRMTTTKITRVDFLPRSAVQDATWGKICAQLASGTESP